MPTLHIALLGDFSLTYDQQLITAVNTARLQAILAYLVLHSNAPQSRRHLAFLLWPDSSEAQARTNLRNLLHLLRQALPMIDNFLQIDTTTVQWRSDAPFTLDLLQFEAALTKAETSDSPTQERAALETAVRLYQGDLLPACYEDWIQPLREQYRQRLIAALTRLIDLLARQPDAPAAIGYAQRLLRIDPLHETTYQQLMQLYVQIGDRAHALNTYHTCATILHRELGVPPSAATQAIYRRLKTGPTPQPAPSLPTAESPFPHGQHNLPTLLTSFIGRKTTIGEIKQALQRSRLVTLTGPGGCGKTRLALAVAAEIVGDYPAGVWLVELSALRGTTHLVTTVAATLSIAEEATRPLVDTLIDHLRDQHLLLILDTCEHLIDGCADLVQTLLDACPQLQILATSRERLAVTGELAWPVPPLTIPPLEYPPASAESAATWLQQYEAVQLLVERIQAVLPTFTVTQQTVTALIQLAVHLDGIPLALELAAARAAHLSMHEIAAHLDQRFQLLQSGAAGSNTSYVITNDQHWIYQGVGIRNGDKIPGIVGYEIDTYDNTQPLPAYRSYTILSASPFWGKNKLFTANSTIYQAHSQAWVFAAGTTSWSWGLDKAGYVDPRLQRLTTNILNAFSNGVRAANPEESINTTQMRTVSRIDSEEFFATTCAASVANLMANADFTTDKQGWLVSETAGTEFTVVNEDGCGQTAQITTDAGKQNLLLYQDGITVEPERHYQLSFLAKAINRGAISVYLVKPDQTYTNLGIANASFDIDTRWQKYVIEFTSTNLDSPINNARLLFWFAPYHQMGSTYLIDEIVLTPIDYRSDQIDSKRLFSRNDLSEAPPTTMIQGQIRRQSPTGDTVPANGATVTLLDLESNGLLFQSVSEANGNGSFLFEGIESGEYLLFIESTEGLSQEPVLLAVTSDQPLTMDLVIHDFAYNLYLPTVTNQ